MNDRITLYLETRRRARAARAEGAYETFCARRDIADSYFKTLSPVDQTAAKCMDAAAIVNDALARGDQGEAETMCRNGYDDGLLASSYLNLVAVQPGASGTFLAWAGARHGLSPQTFLEFSRRHFGSVR